MDKYIILALLFLPILCWALYDRFSHGKPRPLWLGLFLSALGGFLGLLAVPALRARGKRQLDVYVFSVFALMLLARKTYDAWEETLLLSWLVVDRLASLQAVIWLWRKDPERYRMDADALRAWSAAAEAGKSARSGPEEGLAARGAKAADHQTGL